jgi:hypothetical protein
MNTGTMDLASGVYKKKEMTLGDKTSALKRREENSRTI